MKKKEISMNLPLSQEIGELDNTIKKLKQEYVQLWWEIDASIPPFFKTYSLKEQKEIEKEISHFVEKIFDYIEQSFPAQDVEGKDCLIPISQTKQYLERLFHITGIYIDDTFSNGFVRSTRVFLDRVNEFDPSMEPEEIYQALRNVWIMNILQRYFNMEIGCSDSMFAYSMLYPYTDNIIDDVSLPFAKKLQINRNLKERLEGKPYPKATGIEKKLDALITLIEEEFPRDKFPIVFQSMLGIYNAQVKSLIQQGEDLPPYVIDIPGISFEKGGTSVLADGYLIKGELDEAQEDFCFGLGAFLQLADDIQDIVPDKTNSHLTLFSQVAGKYKADALANKLFHYISMIVERGLTDPALKNLRELIHKSFYFHIIEAVGKNRELYTDRYIKELQAHFPFRFSFLKKLRKKLNQLLLKQKKRTFKLDIVSAGLMAMSSRFYE